MTTEERNTRSERIDFLDTVELLRLVNDEDQSVAAAVGVQLPQIARSVGLAADVIRSGGRVFYVGAGTSGRIALLDAVECPATFNSPPEWFQAVLAGGEAAAAHAAEGAEDDTGQAAADLVRRGLEPRDLVCGIAASGRTPFTLGGMQYARSIGARTIALVSAPASPMAGIADVAIVVLVGPEVLTGSTRMKAGTAQKMVLNMFSTATMIRLGMTYGNWMINVGMTNGKLRGRGLRMIQSILSVSEDEARLLVERSGGDLKAAVVMGRTHCSRREAEDRLSEAQGDLRRALGER